MFDANLQWQENDVWSHDCFRESSLLQYVTELRAHTVLVYHYTVTSPDEGVSIQPCRCQRDISGQSSALSSKSTELSHLNQSVRSSMNLRSGPGSASCRHTLQDPRL